MSLFGKILEKLGIKKAEDKAAPAKPTASAPAATPPTTAPKPSFPTPGSAPYMPPKPMPATDVPVVKPAAPTPIPMVDVVGKLEQLAAANPQKLNWKVSIVDLLKLLDLDSSYDARKEMAEELGCPAELMGDSAQMNTWLHKTVLQKLADNGGNIPKELLD